MTQVAPLGSVYQAGTLSGNPITVAAGVATLETLKGRDWYNQLENLGAQLEGELSNAAEETGIPATVNRVGSMFCCFFTEGPVRDLASAQRSDTKRYAQYFHAMLEQGINLSPSQFEAGFISTAHTQDDIARTGLAARTALKSLPVSRPKGRRKKTR
jgi:glutamate-1-semialdehyde 2,1-aminomutase